jgi:hypothetical protein
MQLKQLNNSMGPSGHMKPVRVVLTSTNTEFVEFKLG